MQWSDGAVVYQIYLRSFADSDGDGIGDLAGLRPRLGYIRDLGVDALWLNPCFRSPQVDHGYDVADYCDIDPAYGDLAAFDALLVTAHEQGLRVLLDLVPNHCSTQHPWFREALAAPSGSPERARFHFRPGRGPAGDEPPNNWQSVFGGPAWTRVLDGPHPGEWYLHAFDPAQPDFNWADPQVTGLFEDVLRFWFDRGVDGFRVDVAHGLYKHPDLADWPGGEGTHNAHMWNQRQVHDVYRRWRKIADEYGAAFVGEVWVPSAADLAPYQSADELGQVFSFDLLVQPWHGPSLRAAIDRTQAMVGDGTAAAWVLANHDVHRAVTRYGQEQVLDAPDATDMIAAARREGPVDIALGTRRARAAVLLLLALPGAAYLYQGEELGLPEVLDLPDDAREDPIWLRSGGSELGRDGCRVPMPWTPDGPTLGFSADPSARAWLPQPRQFADLAISRQETDPGSMLGLYREALAARRRAFAPTGPGPGPLHPDGTRDLAGDTLRWLDTGDARVVAFRRGDVTCVANTRPTAFPLPTAWGDVLLASGPVTDGALPPDACAWLSVAASGDVVPPHHAGPSRHDEGVVMHRRTIIGSLTAVTALALTACAPGASDGGDGGDAESTDGGGDTTVTVWHYWDGTNADAFDDLVADYQATHDGATVETVNIPSSDLITKIQTPAQTDTLPTIAIMDLVSVPQVQQTGKLVDLAPLLPADTLSDIYPALLDFGRDGDSQYAVPVSTNNIGYMYNKDLFREAGLDPDNPPATWEELMTQGQQILDATGKPGYELYAQAGDSGEGLTWNFQVNLWQAGGEFLTEDNSAAAFNSDAGREALQYWVDLLDSGIAPSTQWGEFEKGQAGGAQEGSWMVGIWQGDPPFDFGTATVPYPAGGQPATNMGGERAVVFDTDDATEQAAADFLAWFLEPEQVTTWSEATGMLPVRRAVGDSDEYQTWVTDNQPLLQPYVDQLADARSRPNTPLYPRVSLAFAQQIERALNGQATVDEALAAAETAVNDALAAG